ncbi:MAG TPA: metalloregulator ArsR/SmtB family transcription factor [Microbacterium sp.]|nr:metalloregulator ArsR/SmtB family transcription factor [Microbacterium sp.]
MDTVKVFSALANKHRQGILRAMRDPEAEFEPNLGVDMTQTGVCVSQISERFGITQSTASQYMAQLKDAGLLDSERIGKFTYYRRNERALSELADVIRAEL